MTKTLASLILRSEAGNFIGRREEQRIFRITIQKFARAYVHYQTTENSLLFPRIFLLHGLGGIGKTSLVNRFAQICREECGETVHIIKIDWEEYANQVIDSSIDIMDILYGQLAKDHEKEMKRYRETREQKDAVLKKVEYAREEFASLAAVAGEIGATMSGTGSIGKAAIEETIHMGGKLIEAAGNRRNRWIKQRLTPTEFRLYDSLQLEMSKAFVDSINTVAQKKPVVLLFDTYELIDKFNGWMRDGLMMYGSDRLMYVIAGRHDHSNFFLDKISEELIHQAPLKRFSKIDIKDYLESRKIDSPVAVVESVFGVSQGVPLAVKAVANVLADSTLVFDKVFGDLPSYTISDDEKVISTVTRRFLKYCLEDKSDSSELRQSKSEDRYYIYSLALVRQHQERSHRDQTLKAIWNTREKGLSEERIGSILEDLSSRYSFIFGEKADIHPTVRDFMLRALRDQSIPRGATNEINRSAYDFSTTKLAGMSADPQNLYRRTDFREYLLDSLHHLIWFDEREAVHLLTNHFIIALDIHREFAEELLRLFSDDVLIHLSEEHKSIVWALTNIISWNLDSVEQVELTSRIKDLLTEWLERENQIRLNLRNAKAISRRGTAGAQRAIELLGIAESLCETPTEMAQERAEALVQVAQEMTLRRQSKFIDQAIVLLSKSLRLTPHNRQPYLLLGQILYNKGDIQGAADLYRNALQIGIDDVGIPEKLAEMNRLLIELKEGERLLRYTDPKKYAKQVTEEGEILEDSGLHYKAIEKYQEALAAFPKYERASIRLGHAYRRLGDTDKAHELFQRVHASPFNDEYNSSYYSIRAIRFDRMGALQGQIGNLERAASMYKDAIAAQPDHVNALNGLGKIYCLQGDYEGAEQLFRSALMYRYNAYWVTNNLAISLLLMQRREDASATFERALALCQSAIGRKWRVFLSYYGLGIALFGLNKCADGLQAIRQATKISITPGVISEVISDLNLIEKATIDNRTIDAVMYLEQTISQAGLN